MDSTTEIATRVSEIVNQIAATSDESIRQQNQPLASPKSSTKVLPQVMHVLDSANSP